MIAALLYGAGVAFVASLPVTGPASALVADAALRGEGARAARIGLGSAVAEAGWAALALAGAGALLAGASAARAVADLFAGVVLLAVAAALWRAPSEPVARPEAGGRAFWAGFGLTALNPTLLVTWGTVSAGLLATGRLVATPATVTAFAVGVLGGGWAAFQAVRWAFGRAGARLGGRAARVFGRAAAALLFGLGLAALARAATGG